MSYAHANDAARDNVLPALTRALFFLCLAMTTPAVLSAENDDALDDEAAIERAHAERLRRAIEKSEADQTEQARRRDSEFGRQTNVSRLQSHLATLERDESQVHGQLRDTETQLLYMRRDPADMSAHARRSELESRLSYYRSQLNQITAEKQTALRQLREMRDMRSQDLRFR